MAFKYPRANLFSGDGVSDGQIPGFSVSVQGQGNSVNVVLNNPGNASVVTLRRRSNTDDAWAEIGATVTISDEFQMLLNESMDYVWQIKASGAAPATLTLSEPQNSKMPYSEGFSISAGVITGTNTEAFGISPSELILKWSLARAQSGYWSLSNPLVIGSDGNTYRLNPDRGGGIAGNPEVDPVSAPGDENSSWIRQTAGATTIVAADVPLATRTVPGLMSTQDKLKLDLLSAPVARVNFTDVNGTTIGGSGTLIEDQIVSVVLPDSTILTATANSNNNWSMAVNPGTIAGVMTAAVTARDGRSVTDTDNYDPEEPDVTPPTTAPGDQSVVFTITQDILDNGYDIETIPDGPSSTRLTIDEAGGLAQTPIQDYTVDDTLLLFTESFKTQLFPGYTARFFWTTSDINQLASEDW